MLGGLSKENFVPYRMDQTLNPLGVHEEGSSRQVLKGIGRTCVEVGVKWLHHVFVEK